MYSNTMYSNTYTLERGLEEYPLLIHYTWIPGVAAQTYGPPERCYPGEPPEAELVSVTLRGKPFALLPAEESRLYDLIIEDHEEPERDYERPRSYR